MELRSRRRSKYGRDAASEIGNLRNVTRSQLILCLHVSLVRFREMSIKLSEKFLSHPDLSWRNTSDW